MMCYGQRVSGMELSDDVNDVVNDVMETIGADGMK